MHLQTYLGDRDQCTLSWDSFLRRKRIVVASIVIVYLTFEIEILQTGFTNLRGENFAILRCTNKRKIEQIHTGGIFQYIESFEENSLQGKNTNFLSKWGGNVYAREADDPNGLPKGQEVS